MAGERLMLEGYPEISGVCTHPAHRGRGYAAGLIWHLVRRHRSRHLQSWLHVAANNPAILLYGRMGFQTARRITLTYITNKTRRSETRPPDNEIVQSYSYCRSLPSPPSRQDRQTPNPL